MLREIFRKSAALSLSVVLTAGTFAALPAALHAQDTDDKKKAETKKNAEAEQAVIQDKNKALSVKEDPSQIGKRKINAGTDKLFGWLGGSQEKEVALGRQLALEIEQQAKLVEDPIVTEYINRVGQNIVLHSDAKIPFTIKVIDSDEVNAFALPGGFFFVNRGLILAADNEAELAGVMAHEIAHVAARHAMENQGKMTAINYGLIATMIFGGGIAGAVAQNAGGFGQLLSFLQFSRTAEKEADTLGVQYLYASGYDPTAMSTMFEKLNSKNKKKPGTLAKIFASHPQSLERRDSSLALVSRFAEREEYVISTSEFQRVKGHLFKLTNARAGVASDLDDGGAEGRPTLKRREPTDPNVDPDAPAGSSGSSSSSDGPPQLKRRNEPTEPAKPSPSPSPEQ
jgi:Putative Zn-dependent protease, contains TPR repeats